MKILLSGATGFIGKPLVTALLMAGHDLILLSRNPANVKSRPGVSILPWDGKNTKLWAPSAEGVDAIINLAGAGIADQRWSQRRKRILIESRINSTQAIINFIRESKKRPDVFLNASAVGYYGNVSEGEVTEETSTGSDFLARTCAQWEQKAREAEAFGVRTILLRTGIVLEQGGGALSKMMLPFKLFAGGPLGSGKQWFPWIHRDDILGAILYALENKNLEGPLNLVSPNPVTMNSFCKALGKVLHRPSWAPVPGFMLRLMLGEMAEMLLGGQKALPKKLTEAGYSFKYSTVDAALNKILG